MTRSHLLKSLFTALCVALLAACATTPTKMASTTALAPAADRLVVLISVDGLAAYYLDDPKADMPTIKRLAREGARAVGMKCAMPSVTWPTHTTMATGCWAGRHGVIGNSYWDREAGKSVPFIPDPLFDKDEIVKVPTIYDVVHRAGLKTAAVCWPASRNAKTLDWTVPDIFPDDLFQKCSTQSWLTELRAANIPFWMQETWCKAAAGGPARDWMYARMASHVIRHHLPNLLMLHLMEPDHVQHGKGPQTPDAYWSCSYEDDRVRDVLEVAEATFPGRVTFIVVSDHGFNPYTREIRPNVKLRQDGLIKMEGSKVVSRQANALGQGGSTFIYVMDKERRSEIVAKLAGEFRSVEGIEVVIEQKDYAKFGLVTPDKDPHMGDLVLGAKEGYAFSDSAAGDAVIVPVSGGVKGTHGYNPAQKKMRATFVAWGAGIRPGVKLPDMDATDLAPTIARLLGINMTGTDGKVREEILK
ncbi:MAG: ectonucleotide pyrophosphatase/phosphodiesterase [Verrucomicrobia bacterium]|nr:ectonucleotide pyrophosphatase/phosphodiesterase [Verrucomicrobiota bacterium]